MVNVDASLFRLQQTFTQLVRPSSEQLDIGSLKLQIELRRRALKDIDAILCRFRPFHHSAAGGPYPRRKLRPTRWRAQL